MELPVSLLSVAQVRESERRALAVPGVDGLMLMRRAAQAAFDRLREQWPLARGFTVLCGGGNNGGDGWMMAALGRAAGLDARVSWTHPPQVLRGEASVAAAEALAAGVLDVIVDALLGIGIVEPVRAPIAAAIAAINSSGRPVLALDVPSGLCADSGRVLGTAVRADVTVTFIALKAGLLLGEGPEHAGRVSLATLEVAPLPPEEAAWQRIDVARVRAAIPLRRRDAHKGLGGRVCIVGGGEGMAGAARLAGEAALRVGAGRVTVACAAASAAAVAGRPELMVHPLPVDPVAAAARLAELLTVADVIVAGPGLGRDPWALALLTVVRESGRPMVLDADALYFPLTEVPANAVLTPHPGEAARLLGGTASLVQADRPAALRALLDRHAAVVVLKGAGSLVGQRGRVPQVCDRGHPVLAAPGTGDVLAGAIGGLLAQSGDPWGAAVAAVWLHARAGELLANDSGRGVLAGEVAAALPCAMAEVFSA
ncbi:MAG: NAD(P)H-hydrate dehydratase [Xanthomonadales bacterium]|nr:NAD(P)H-hydrate dehydratase [Xanthomonadales bacterium]